MVTILKYALMAGASYDSTRTDKNKIPAPLGWTEVTNSESYYRDPNSGFEVVAFQRGSEIVNQKGQRHLTF